ncbi:MAG: RNA-binding transcriptional accessory protein [Deltaproteobacteria bacterium]|nr:RNA-binding transcriptional accessory protein [Deltaproteobacteria bacterium]
MSVPVRDFPSIISEELQIPRAGVEKTVSLLGEGATIPFVARYRKEMTGGLDEVQLGQIQERFEYLTELESRRKTILESISEQGKLTDELAAKILATKSKTELEDLYLPYKPKRRTRAIIARERGLEPLADEIRAQKEALSAGRDELARPFVSAEKGVPDVESAWQGARDIVAERVADDADVRGALRELALAEGRFVSRAADLKGKGPEAEKEAKKFADYFDFEEPVKSLPSHRVLALRRGEKEGYLRVVLEMDRDECYRLIRSRVLTNPRAALAADLIASIEDSYDRLLKSSIEVDVRLALKERADSEAIRVFADNLRHLLLFSPMGTRRILALDPGFRTGCKVVVLDDTGNLLEDAVVYPHEPQKREAEARATLAALAKKHRVQAVAVGNGTAGRETEALMKSMKKAGELPEGCIVVSVNESGASVYSASEIAREEFPDRDVTVRGAVSIGRRLQDPLAELVKIDPKSIGVGQYQHDVNQSALKKSLDSVVESCVNAVGVEANTASAKLLSYVSGIGETLAKNIIAHRAARGPFRSRKELLSVPRLGPKAFEQAAGFLRIRGGENPLDESAVHPESYDVVEKMAADLGVSVAGLVGMRELVRKIDIKRYIDEKRGEPTLRDILSELEKPGRDPREKFEEVGFRDDVTEFEHLQEGMVLPGVITNVTAFGAFVDIGVHQDGLVHVSELSHRFVKDPAEVAKVGERVQVRVIKVDKERRRIGLSIKQVKALEPEAKGPGRKPLGGAPASGRQGTSQKQGKSGPSPRTPFNQIRIKPMR